MGIGGFIALLVYIGFVYMENNFTSGFPSALMLGISAAIGSYMTIQNSIPQNYSISTLTKKIIITILIFFGGWYFSTIFMVNSLNFDEGLSGFLGFGLSVWAAHYYAVSRQNKLKRKEQEAKAREEAKITKEAKKKEREIQKEEQRKAWFSKLENDLA